MRKQSLTRREESPYRLVGLTPTWVTAKCRLLTSRKVGNMSLVQMINSLSWIIINAASDGYVSSNDVDFANECLDKIQGRPTKRAADGAKVVGESNEPLENGGNRHVVIFESPRR